VLVKRLPAPGVLARAVVPPGGYAPFQFGVGGLQPLFAGGQDAQFGEAVDRTSNWRQPARR
jgi:hypothetical protein